MKFELKYGIRYGDYNEETHEFTIRDGEGKVLFNRYVYPLCEEPEDAIIGRALIDGEDVLKYCRKAYEAGAAGEDFIVEKLQLEDGEEE